MQPGRQAAAQAHGAAKLGDDTDLLRNQNQVLYAHDFRHGRSHFRGQARCQGAQAVLVGGVAEQPVAKPANGQVADRGEGLQVMAVDDQPGDFIGLVGDQCFLQKISERNVSQGHLRSDPLTVVLRGHACQKISGTGRAGLGHHVFKAIETVGLGANRM